MHLEGPWASQNPQRRGQVLDFPGSILLRIYLLLIGRKHLWIEAFFGLMPPKCLEYASMLGVTSIS